MYTTVHQDTELERNVLEKMGTSWDYRVAVRQQRLDLSQYYDATIPDFPISMVPFAQDPEFLALDEPARLRLLAAAWVAYNEKAIYLEDEIVQPLCGLLLKSRLPGAGDARVKQVIAQVMVDEQFHILMCLDICNNARERHQLQDYVVPEPNLGLRMKEALAAMEDETSQAVVRLVYASVAEMSINAYLNQVATDNTIQPLNRINTDMHRRDESAHSMAFRQIVASIYRRLAPAHQALFREQITQALGHFTAPDHGSWASILEYLQVPGREAILQRLQQQSQGRRLARDYTALRSLFEEVGVAGEVQFDLA